MFTRLFHEVFLLNNVEKLSSNSSRHYFNISMLYINLALKYCSFIYLIYNDDEMKRRKSEFITTTSSKLHSFKIG